VVTLDTPPEEAQGYEVEILTRSGEYVDLGTAGLGGEIRAWGGSISVDLSEMVGVRLLAPDGDVAFVATLEADDPWD
jgi:hypothetical protein